MRNSVVITGVSSGFGRAIAAVLLRRGYRVFGTLRNKADAESARETLGEHFTPLLCDITDEGAVTAAAREVASAVGDSGIAALINNAGVATLGPLVDTPVQELRDVFEVNVFAVVSLTKAFLPLLRGSAAATHKPGRIINISSTGGCMTFPLFGVYSASKHALESLNDAMRLELSIYGIEVVAIEPGSVRTSIWDKPAVTAIAADSNPDYAPMIAAAPAIFEERLNKARPISVVTDAVCKALEAEKPRTRYPLDREWYLSKLVSDRLLDRLMLAKFLPGGSPGGHEVS